MCQRIFHKVFALKISPAVGFVPFENFAKIQQITGLSFQEAISEPYFESTMSEYEKRMEVKQTVTGLLYANAMSISTPA